MEDPTTLAVDTPRQREEAPDPVTGWCERSKDSSPPNPHSRQGHTARSSGRQSFSQARHLG